jgi:GntR family transcriptional regulator
MENEHVRDEINRSVPIPLYYQIAQILRHEIEKGKFKPGENIPIEEELQKRFGVSRATIRQAISDLVYSGLLERKRSKGTRVSQGRLEATLVDLASFTNEMMSANVNLTTKILDFKHIPPPDPVGKILQLNPDDRVAVMERVRCVDGRPIAIEHWYAALKYFPGISRKLFKDAGMEQSTYYILMNHYNIKINSALDTVSPVGIEAREAKLLNVELGKPALLRTRISYSSEGYPITYASGIYLIQLKFFLGPGRPVASHVTSIFQERNE